MMTWEELDNEIKRKAMQEGDKRVFCDKCGEKLQVIEYNPHEPDEYNTMTGELVRYYRKVCPSGRCNHVGVSHKFNRKKGFWNRFFGFYECVDCKAVIAGKPDHYDNYRRFYDVG